MSAYITLVCPDCGKSTVFNGSGYCVCGSQLIAFWKGKHRGKAKPYDFYRRVWVFDDNLQPFLINVPKVVEDEWEYIFKMKNLPST